MSLVQVDDTLSDVEIGLLLIENSVELQERGVLGLSAESSLESGEDGLDVKTENDILK